MDNICLHSGGLSDAFFQCFLRHIRDVFTHLWLIQCRNNYFLTAMWRHLDNSTQ